eukprot:5031010-Alexandrium_andersonii.AAC.1
MSPCASQCAALRCCATVAHRPQASRIPRILDSCLGAVSAMKKRLAVGARGIDPASDVNAHWQPIGLRLRLIRSPAYHAFRSLRQFIETRG